MANERKARRAPRGMRDVLPDEVALWRLLEETAARLARLRGFREIRPPLVEETELFVRSVGEVTDIVEKEMFTLQKEGGSLSLRPEGTAGIVRAYLQAGWARTQPVQKLFHVGPMFRHERPQKGRERMFTQFDVEALGSLDPRLDAEVIHLAALFFEEVVDWARRERGGTYAKAQFDRAAFGEPGSSPLVVRLSSMGDGEDRDRYREAVRAFLAPRIDEHCELCRRRFERNVLRVLDCKNPRCHGLHAGAPGILEHLSDDNRAHFESVRRLLEGLGRTVEIDGALVRGLDYYTRTVFEIHWPALGARSALCGGGRYDHLVRDLGGPDLGAVGFAIGFTGTLILLRELGVVASGVAIREADVADVFVVAAGDEEEILAQVLRLAEELRAAGISAVFDTEAKSVKAQMKVAGKGEHRFALILGEDELRSGVVQVKDLIRGGEQETVSRARAAEVLRRRLDLGATRPVEA